MNYDKIVAEYSTIAESDFWKLFISNIAKQRTAKRNDLELANADTFSFLQGYISGLTFILGKGEPRTPSLVEFIFRQLREEGEKENK